MSAMPGSIPLSGAEASAVLASISRGGKEEIRAPAAASHGAAGDLGADSLEAHINRLRSPQHEKTNTPVSISWN
jgi:hypothetical protein